MTWWQWVARLRSCLSAAGGYQPFSSLEYSPSWHQPSLVRDQGQGHSALSALGRITLRVSVPCSHSSNPHHCHNHPRPDQSDRASPVQPEDQSHCSTFVCPGTKGHVSAPEHAPINTYVLPANYSIERGTARIPLRGRHISPQGGSLSHCFLSLEIQEPSYIYTHIAVCCDDLTMSFINKLSGFFCVYIVYQ